MLGDTSPFTHYLWVHLSGMFISHFLKLLCDRTVINLIIMKKLVSHFRTMFVPSETNFSMCNQSYKINLIIWFSFILSSIYLFVLLSAVHFSLWILFLNHGLIFTFYHYTNFRCLILPFILLCQLCYFFLLDLSVYYLSTIFVFTFFFTHFLVFLIYSLFVIFTFSFGHSN